ncbi:hypothetical protein TNCV_193701 [Trichonephila clavipes]|nr:hypothetical protein TNCV_193701 [Trichonephila clavipes]
MGKLAPPLSAALTLQQCLIGDTEEWYHQPIDRSGLTPASLLQRSVGLKVFPGHHFPPYGTPHTASMRVEKPTLLVEKKNQII